MKNYFLLAAIIFGTYSSVSSAATQSFWAFGSDDSAIHALYINNTGNPGGSKTMKFNIDYSLDSNWKNISAHLWLKAVDDFNRTTHCSGSTCSDVAGQGGDGSEQALIVEIEGHPGSFAAKEINEFGWYDLGLDVTSFLLADADNKFTAKLKSTIGSDFWFKNAKLVVDYDLKPVPVPAAVWLFGSALLGLTGMKRKSASAAAVTA